MELIYASDSENGISKKGAIPWRISGDMKYFRKTTMGAIVIMGRKTWESLPDESRPLKGRINIVLTSTIRERATAEESQVHYCPNIISVLDLLEEKKFKSMKKFVIGGLSVYEQFIGLGLVNIIHKTDIYKNYDCDQFFELPSQFVIRGKTGFEHVHLLRSEDGETLLSCINQYILPNHEELKFLELMEKAKRGISRPSRTGVGTVSTFCHQLRFDLSRYHIPLLTTRPVPLKTVFHELMWFLSGSTDVAKLHEKGIHIWDANSNAEFLKKYGMPYEEWDIGPSYGFQMRYAGAIYKDCKTDYKEQGFDQLADVISKLKSDPSGRRIMINLWNVADVEKMALPPCAFCYQFYVSEGRLSCNLTQRSSDIALAGGWNIATASLLTFMLAKVTKLKPGELIWSPADIHIYMNQLEGVEEQLKREPRQFPMIYLKDPEDGDITKFTWDKVDLYNYEPHKKIKFVMNA